MFYEVLEETEAYRKLGFDGKLEAIYFKISYLNSRSFNHCFRELTWRQHVDLMNQLIKEFKITDDIKIMVDYGN